MANSSADWTDRIIAAVQSESTLNVNGGLADAELSTSSKSDWSESAIVPATAIRDALLSTELPLKPFGLVLQGAWIDGELDLTRTMSPIRLVLQRCRLPEGISATEYRGRSVGLHQCTTGGIDFNGAILEGILSFRLTQVNGTLSAIDSDISRRLVLQGAAIDGLGKEALVLDGASIGGDAFLHELRATGETRALGLKVAGQLIISRATLSNPGADALCLDQAQIGSASFLDELHAEGAVRARGIGVAGQLSLREATLENDSGDALNFDGARIQGAALFNGLHAVGEVRALNAHFESQVSFRDAVLKNLGGDALSLDGTILRGSLFMDRIETAGTIRAPRSTIEGELSLVDSNLANPGGDALNIDAAKIEGDAFLNRLKATGAIRASDLSLSGQFSAVQAVANDLGGVALNLDRASIEGGAFLDELTATGEVRALSAKVGAQLSFNEATFSNTDRPALNFDGAYIDGGAFFSGISVEGEIRALHTTITKQFVLNDATLHNPGEHALSLDGASIGGDAFLDNISVNGTARAPRITITGELLLNDVKLHSPDGLALNLEGSRISAVRLTPTSIAGYVQIGAAEIGELVLESSRDAPVPLVFRVNAPNLTTKWLVLGGRLAGARWNLARASIDRLELREPSGVTLAGVEGWRVGSVHGALQHERRVARNLLDTVPRESNRQFASGPWREFADAIERGGRSDIARGVRVAAAHRGALAGARWSVGFRLLYGALVGYGYRPWYTVIWLAGLYLFVLCVLHLLNPQLIPQDGAASAIANGAEYRDYLFALDLSLPIAATGQSTLWMLTGPTWMLILFAAVKAVSWALVALLLGGITGILQKSH